MKKKYSAPELDVILLTAADIITASPSQDEDETFKVNPDGSIDFPTIPFG